MAIPDTPWPGQDWVNSIVTAAECLRTGTARSYVHAGRAHLKPEAPLPSIGDTTSLPMEFPVVVPLSGEEVDLGRGRGIVEVRVTGVEDLPTGPVISFEAASSDPV